MLLSSYWLINRTFWLMSRSNMLIDGTEGSATGRFSVCLNCIYLKCTFFTGLDTGYTYKESSELRLEGALKLKASN